MSDDPDLLLGDSKAQALACFTKLERRLQRSPDLYTQYKNFMHEYAELKHMKLLENDDCKRIPYYFPHHCVLKPDSTTTKLRVVFNGSAKTTSGKSLNDLLIAGPTLQQDLFMIVIRFRLYKVVLTGDLTKMHRQILIHPAHAHLQRIVWRDDPSEPLRTYELGTVTYGTKPASFEAVMALQQTAIDAAESFPLASKVTLRDYYVDDMLTGTDTLDSALQLRDEMKGLLKTGGFEMRKWASNFAEILDDLNDQETLYQIPFEKEATLKPLGLEWKPTDDTLQYSITSPDSAKVTKRSILSSVASIFDPLGLIAPVIWTAKVILQRLWKSGIEWDDELPTEIQDSWQQFVHELPQIGHLQIPRRFLTADSPWELQLHGFCDASEAAYGACAYAVIPGGSSHLICARSKVAPVKKISLPRLELCGALLLTRLIRKVTESLPNKMPTYLWTDSTIVLCWITSSKEWKTFVSNRVSEIQQLTSNDQWRHIPGHDNPADIVSRGCSPSEIAKTDLWWHGPNWVTQPPENWPAQQAHYDLNESTSEERIVHSTCFDTPTAAILEEILLRHSSMKRVLRVLVTVQRYLAILKSRCDKTALKFNRLEATDKAELLLVFHCQQRHFSNELHAFKNRQPLLKTSTLKQLDPFLDEDGFLRVGGRLRNATIPYNHKFPILLPSKDLLTKLLIQREHLRLLHAGSQLTLSSLRQHYWPLSGKRTVRDIISRCAICFRLTARPIVPKMGDLPCERVVPSRPFSSTGVDYTGPLLLKHGGPRSKVLTKSYAAIFVCMASKAVHIELVSSLTSDAYINTLRRFIARRGMVKQLFSDNGTNFVGAMHELQSLLDSKEVRDTMHDLQIDFRFIPARSPHFGGLWESAVKSLKRHLIRVVGETKLNFEDLTTLLTQIEAVLNSRPLCALSNDPADLTCLTPGHFLVGEPLTALPSTDFTSTNVNRLTHWEHILRLKRHFWNRWQREYLHTLQERSKWRTDPNQPIKAGQLVLLKDSNLPPLRWNLARAEALHPGNDGITRAITLMTARGTVRRAVINVCPLPETTEI